MSQTYGSLREKIAAEKADRAARYAGFEKLVKDAHRAGMEALAAAKPRPMIVGSPTTPLGNDIDPTKPTYYVSEGVCGFAWITVRPATSSFGRWALANGWSKAYNGGAQLFVHEGGQSYERKCAYAAAYADTLSKGLPDNVRVTTDSRLD